MRKSKTARGLLAGKLAGYDFHRAKARERKNEVLELGTAGKNQTKTKSDRLPAGRQACGL